MSEPDPRTFVIVGAGQAGRWLVLTLRAEGFAGRIVWFGDEAHRAYERPPLSKAVLKGEAALESLALIDAERFASLDIDWSSLTGITAIDRTRRVVVSATGEAQPYDALFLAVGGRARQLPGVAAHPRIHTLRTWDDAVALKSGLTAARRVAVLGGGWIGLEVAASARLMGHEVTVLEAAPRLCARTVPPCVSEQLLALHQRHGTEVRLGAQVSAVVPAVDGVTVRCNDGSEIGADLLVLGIGLVPNDELARAAGLDCENGVLTDASGRSSDAAIFAVGDVANALGVDGLRRRTESWENAQRQAVAAARAALARPHDAAADGPPWFWSDQYDCNLQVLGSPDATHHVVERHIEARGQRLYFFCDGTQICALAAINAGREVKIVRKWMQQGRFPTLEALTNTDIDLQKLPLAAPSHTEGHAS